MTLKVIGSGLGRTGTMSLKLALEQLGFGSCHHMIEVLLARPESAPLWVEAGQGRPDWDAIYAGYQATVDYPGAMFWRELAAHYPDAKIVHTVRDPDDWFESTQETIFADRSPAMMIMEGPLVPFFAMIHAQFGQKIHDRAFMLAHFRQQTADVKAAIPRERLLIYEISQGWTPLCKFLGVPVPDAPFPSENSRAEFKARAESLSARA